MSTGDLVGRVLQAIASCFGDLGDALDDPALLEGLVSDLGGTLAAGTSAASIKSILGPVPADLDALATAAAGLDLSASAAQLLPASNAVITAITKVVNDAHALAVHASSTTISPFDDPAFWARFFDDALMLLAYNALREHLPGVYALLRALGVAAEQTSADGVSVQHVIHWDRLPAAMSDPGSVLTDAYGWNSSFNASALLDAVADASNALGLTVTVEDPANLAQACWHPVALDPDHATAPLRVSLYRAVLAIGSMDPILAGVDVGIEFLPIPDTTGQGTPVGVAIALDVQGTLGEEIDLAPGVTLRVNLGGDASVRAELRPSGVRLVPPVAAAGGVTSTLAISAQPSQAWVLGDRGGTRLEIHKAVVTASVDASSNGSPEARLRLEINASACIDFSSADGFLQTIFGSGISSVAIPGTLTWSSLTGLRLMDGVGLRGAIPLTADIGGIVHLTGAAAEVEPQPPGTRVALGISGTLSLGPFAATVDSLGIAVTVRSIAHGAAPGNLGPLDLQFGFEPPKGIGLAIQSPAVSGGGFLLFDPDAGQYAGVFELTIVGTVSVKAIAIITTKMPDGAPGFALLILITAEGFTPIQLGLGFSLTGIGGLLALNHTVDADAVRGGLRSGVLDSVLFVKNPVKNAPRVISTLNHVFPLAADRLLIGPLAEISWGTPPLVKIRLALLLEVPQPIRVILLAALSMMLPTPQNAVVEIHVDSIGVLDFGQRELALDASLHDSRILQFTLTGDMALRLNWGDEPTFVVSIGGFHPRYIPPKGLRPLNRLALTLSSGDNPRVRFEAYLALTSNTIQMGARVDVHAVEGAFALDGGGSFDALIQWSPFTLDVAFAAWVKITSGGSTLLAASVALEVTGPQPWHVTGQASVQVLAFTATVGVDFTIGTAPSTPVVTETVDVGAEIWAQLNDPARWAATLPPTATPGVTMAGLPVASNTAPLVAHPLATVSVREQIAPLGIPIERVGGRLPVGGTRSYTASMSAAAGVVGGTVTELFAPGQYANLPDDARLAGPSFAPMTGGVSLTPQTAVAAGPGLSCDLAVQTLDVTSLDAPARPGAWVAAEAGTARGPASVPRMGQVTT